MIMQCRFLHFYFVFRSLRWCGFQDVKADLEAATAEEEENDESQEDDDQEIFTCPYPDCGHTFKYKRSSVFHQRTKHGGVYGGDKLVAFFCRIKNCGRTFYSSSSLAKHQKYMHGLVSISGANYAWYADVSDVAFTDVVNVCSVCTFVALCTVLIDVSFVELLVRCFTIFTWFGETVCVCY